MVHLRDAYKSFLLCQSSLVRNRNLLATDRPHRVVLPRCSKDYFSVRIVYWIDEIVIKRWSRCSVSTKNWKFKTWRAKITYNFDSLVNIICISHGIGIGWMSPTLRKLQTADSPLSFPLGVKEMSWVGSALGIGSMIGNSLSGLLINRLGSKACLLFIAIPHSVGSIYTFRLCISL